MKKWESRKLTPAQRAESLYEKNRKKYGSRFAISDREMENLYTHLEKEAYNDTYET